MRSTPKEIGLKIDRIENSWEEIAPAKSFGGMTLAQFKTFTAASRDARSHLADLEAQITQAQNVRDDADKVFMSKAQLVVNGVLADPTEGPDSALYEAMGYTRKSERKSGLTRGKNQPAGGTPPPAP